MKLKQVFKKYAGKIVILQPAMRDAATGKALSFKVVKECYSVQEAVSSRGYYHTEGFEGVFLYPCVEDAAIPPEETARMFRVLYGRE